MSNRLLFIILVISLSISISIAKDNTYGSIGISVVDTDEFDSTGVGPLFKFGYLLGDKKNTLGIEIEANPMFADMNNDNNTSGSFRNSGSGMNGDFAMTLGTSIIYNFEIPRSNFTIRPRVGVIFPNIGEDIYKDSTSFSYGASVLYDFGGIDGYLSYDSFGSSASRYSLGVAFGF